MERINFLNIGFSFSGKTTPKFIAGNLLRICYIANYMATKTKNNQNGLSNIIFNIILPVVILKQLSTKFGENGPVIALILALSLPLAFGALEYYKTKKHNLFSILGFVNVFFTGGFALMELEGIWFAIKEGAFPLIIGIIVLVSTKWEKPLIKMLLFNEQLFDVEKIESSLKENNSEKEFDSHLRISTKYFAFTFFLSAILNFVLAIYIFKDIPQSLSVMERKAILNEQIAEMTWLSFIVIMAPSMICMFWLLSYLFKGIKKYTGFGMNDVIVSHSK